jgi:prophage antirepressor-like protein
MSTELVLKRFEGKPIVSFMFKGRQAWLAFQIGVGLGYSDKGKEFVKRIGDEWSNELIKGHDYDVITGDELRDLKALQSATEKELGGDSTPSCNTDEDALIHPFARSVVILYEPGLHLSILKSRMPAGIRMRRWLSDDVLPKLARGAQVSPSSSTLLAENKRLNILVEQLLAEREEHMQAYYLLKEQHAFAQQIFSESGHTLNRWKPAFERAMQGMNRALPAALPAAVKHPLILLQETHARMMARIKAARR